MKYFALIIIAVTMWAAVEAGWAIIESLDHARIVLDAAAGVGK